MYQSKKRDKGLAHKVGQEIPRSDSFWYLGSIIYHVGEIGHDFMHRIKTWWSNGVLLEYFVVSGRL